MIDETRLDEVGDGPCHGDWERAVMGAADEAHACSSVSLGGLTMRRGHDSTNKNHKTRLIERGISQPGAAYGRLTLQ